MTAGENLTSEQMRERLVALVQERRGEDIVVLDVSELVDYMDFLVLVTARSERQNRAIADHVRKEMKQHRLLPLSRAGYDGGSWICLDYVDVVLHSFTSETRAYYDLELLWADAKPVEVPDLTPMSPQSPGADEVGDDVADEVADEVGDEVADEVADEVGDEVADEVIDEVADG